MDEQQSGHGRTAGVNAGSTLLARADEIVVSPLAGEQRLERLARLSVPALAGWCAIDVPAENGDLRRFAVAHAPGAAPQPGPHRRRHEPGGAPASVRAVLHDQGAGTGLGLATVFGVVKQTGGSIYAYSEEGSGTTLKIYLPASESAAGAAAAAVAEPTAAAGSETVVVVEDSEGVRQLVRIMLESSGYRVHALDDDPAAAIRLCSEHDGPIDLLLTDVVMPEMSGPELAGRLAAQHPGLRVLFMSGYADDAVFRHGVLSPEAAFIEKPFTARTLAAKVRAVLDA